MIRQALFETINNYDGELRVTSPLWEEIAQAYSSDGRFYHNLNHLENMLSQLLPVKDNVKDWDALILALCYHDIIYDPLKNSNEEESAALAEKRLSNLSISKAKRRKVQELILATKTHTLTDEADLNLFTDADLSILGSDDMVYQQYAAAIRMEYAAVPDMLYIPGRIKVLNHFLGMNQIFKTNHFHHLLEGKARKNLAQELFQLWSKNQ